MAHARQPLRLVMREAVDRLEHRTHLVGRGAGHRGALAALQPAACFDRACERRQSANDDRALQPGEREQRRQQRRQQHATEAGDSRVQSGDVLGDGDRPLGARAGEAARIDEQRLAGRPRTAGDALRGARKRGDDELLVPQRAREDRFVGRRGAGGGACLALRDEVMTRQRQPVLRPQRLACSRRRIGGFVEANVQHLGVVLEARGDVTLDQFAREVLQADREQRGHRREHQRERQREPVAQRAHPSP